MSEQLMEELDADRDGALSLEELTQRAGEAAAAVLDALDSDGDGVVSGAELTSAFDAARPAGPPPPSEDIAAAILAGADADRDGALSVAEIGAALGQEDAGDDVRSGFAALDTDGDGALSLTELTRAFNQYARASAEGGASETGAAV